MNRYYKPAPVSSLRLSPRNKKLYAELLDAPKSTSTVNAEISRVSYEKSQGRPVIVRRALALESLFTQMPVYIREDELLVGNRSEALGVMPSLPEYPGKTGSPRSNRNDARYEALELHGNYYSRLSEEAKRAETCLLAGYPAGSVNGFGHIMADYGMIVREGALALAEKAEKQAFVFAATGDEKRRDFCEASAIACRGFSAWGARYAKLAVETAQTCNDPVRRAELLLIAEICGRVPAYPARTFREALQAMLFAHQAMMIEQQGGSISIGGFDRILYPFYEADMQNGELEIDIASELVEAFYIKLMENAIWPREVVNFCNMAIGGTGAENDLTWLALDTVIKTKSTHPLLSFRWYDGIDPELWERVVSVVGVGTGLPAVFSDRQMIDILSSWGVDRGLAAEYGVVGCVEPAINGLVHGQTLGGHVNALLCLELAMNDGCRLCGGERIGLATGKLSDFTCMDDIINAYSVQVRYACELNREAVFATAEAQRECYGYPLMSSLMHGAVENGRDITDGAEYNFTSVCITGVTNVTDSLLSIQKLVFEEGKYSLAQLYDALMADYAGYDEMLADIRTSKRRFGCGDSDVVKLYNEICEIHTSELMKLKAPRGNIFVPGLWTTSWHVRQGEHTGASPDGRKSGDPLADCAGPVSSRAAQSPTAVIRNVAGIDALRHYPGGYVFNQKFSGSLFNSKEQIVKLCDYIAAFFKMGGMQMQINIHSKETLLAAQKNPDAYKDLVVRVAGFSAYFTSLDSALQNEIISRTSVEV